MSREDGDYHCIPRRGARSSAIRREDPWWVEEYLKAHDLTPRREYTEERDGAEYLVYYFGQGYLEPHLEAVAAIAEGSS